jgi:hypothetical protein
MYAQLKQGVRGAVDWKTFTVELAKALSWPTAAIVLGLAIRRPVASLLDVSVG